MTQATYRCHLDPASRLGTLVFSGVFGGKDFAEGMRALYTHPAWQPGFSALWDFSGGRPALSPGDLLLMEEVYREVEPNMGSGRAAFVVPEEMTAMIAQLLFVRLRNEHRERRTFDDADAALGWLRAA